MIFNNGQEFVINKALDWYYGKDQSPFQYAGNAGTGKSVVMGEIIRRLGLDPITEVAAMSYIGSASILMRLRGLLNAKTIHSWLYEVVSTVLRDEYGRPVMDNLLNVPIHVPKFIPRESLPSDIKLILIDEAWTVPLQMKAEIEKFGKRILAAGDSGQLPPVNDMPAYLNDSSVYYLTEVMRQGDRTDIVSIANRIRAGLQPNYGYYGNVFIINRQDLTDDMLMWADAVICGKNATRDYYNKRIRSILGYSGDLPKFGEKIVCRKNDWLESVELDNGGEISLVNGLIGRVMNNPDVSTFDGKLFSMNFVPDLLPSIQFNNLRCNYKHIASEAKVRDSIRRSRYEVGSMFEFGYALTGWIAQGSQWNNVIYIEDWMHPSVQTQLNYVGVTRAAKNLIYVKL